MVSEIELSADLARLSEKCIPTKIKTNIDHHKCQCRGQLDFIEIWPFHFGGI